MSDPIQTTVVQSAALTSDEQALLIPIVDDPTNIAARVEYDRWLEARGDKRLHFSRAVTEFVGELNQNPERSPILSFDSSGYSRAWTSMLGDPLFRAFRQSDELWEVRDLVLCYAKPTLRITPEAVGIDRMPIQGSRFGGRASLPAEMPWPSCSSGPLRFLGQIALHELSLTQVARELPTSGWLSFFAYDEWGGVGAGPDDDDTRVIYVPGDAELVWRQTPSEVLQMSGEIVACRLVCTDSWDLPDESDFVVAEPDQARLKTGETPAAFNRIPGAEHSYSCHLLGYSRHFRTSDPSPGAEWRNLLCLSSVWSLGWNWCDGEHVAIFIESDALRRHDFNRVFGYAS